MELMFLIGHIFNKIKSKKLLLETKKTPKYVLIKTYSCHPLLSEVDFSTIQIKSDVIMKTCLNNFDSLKPHFYIVKLGFTRVYIIFLIFAQKHRLWLLARTASSRWF